MDKIYEQAKDLHVSATVFYTTNHYDFLYIDLGCKVKATQEEVIDAFQKGTMLIVAPPKNMCKPISLEVKETYVSILCELNTYGSDTRQSIQLVAGTPPDM